MMNIKFIKKNMKEHKVKAKVKINQQKKDKIKILI